MNSTGTGAVESLDVQYTINGGHDTNLDPDLVKPYQELSRRGRSRRIRDVFEPEQQTDKENENKPKQRSKSMSAAVRMRSASKPRRKSGEKETKAARAPKNVQKTVKRKVATRKQVVQISPKDEQFVEACSIGDGIPREIVVPRQQQEKNLTSKIAFKVSPLGKMYSKSQYRKRSSPAASIGVYDEVSAPRDSESFSVAAQGVSSVSPRTETRAKRLATGHLSDSENNHTNQSIPGNPSDNAYGISQPRVHLTLEQVYNDQKREATSFVNNVVAGRQQEEEAPEETQRQPSPPPPMPSPTDERQNAFQQLLNELLMVNDMAMDEDTIMDEVNHCSKQRRQDGLQFSPEETEKFIQTLAGQNKIMRSDGMIICI